MKVEQSQPLIHGKNDPRYSILAFRNRSPKGILRGQQRYHEQKLGFENDHENSPFEQDIQRIERSKGWRRLQNIYQFNVPVHLDGRHQYQNRLTHSNDVQEVGKTIARRLFLDRDSIDLVRAIAAIHDIGHLPFTHWGEEVAIEKLANFGRSWKHDSAGLRVITEWENYSISFPGLNLTLDTIEGLTKRYWHYRDDERLSHYNHSITELPYSIREIDRGLGLNLDKHNHIEGQIAAVADWIAFTSTDIEDGLRSGWMSLEEVFQNFPLSRDVYEIMAKDMTSYYTKGKSSVAQLQRENINRQEALNRSFAALIRNALIADLVEQINKNTGEIFRGDKITTDGRVFEYADDVRDAKDLVVTFSPRILKQMILFQDFCVRTAHGRMLESIGPVQKLVEIVVDDFVAGKIKLDESWSKVCELVRNSKRPPVEINADLTHLAFDFLVQQGTDDSVISYVKKTHPEIWQTHFNGQNHPAQNKSKRFNRNVLVGSWQSISPLRKAVIPHDEATDITSTLYQEKIEQLRIIIDDGNVTALHEQAQLLHADFVRLNANRSISLNSCTALLDALHKFQRLSFLYHANVSTEDIGAVNAVAVNELSWANYPLLPIDQSLCKQLASRFMHSTFQHIAGGEYLPFNPEQPPLKKEKILLIVSPYANGTAEHIVSYMLKYDIPFEVDFADQLSKKALYERCDNNQLQSLVAFHGSRYDDVKSRISIVSNPPKEAADKTGLDPNGEKQAAFLAPQKALMKKLQSGEAFYSLTLIPTPEDAELDGIAYDDYLKLFFEACDQPWSAIQRASAHLISKLEQANSVHIIDEDTGTNLSLRVEGKKWANSLVLKNIPGSEVFASPIRDSVNGKLVAKGKFQYKNGIIEDITLEFKDGRVVAFDAAVGLKELVQIIEADDGKGEGSRYVGEFALGTNPWLKNHLVNGLLVEKISSSFHIALGESYTYTKYDGKQVVLDNKNTSASGTHWDITTMLKGPNSRMVLDERTDHEYIVMQAGLYTDPDLQVLNNGWESIHEAERPSYWQTVIANRLLSKDNLAIIS